MYQVGDVVRTRHHDNKKMSNAVVVREENGFLRLLFPDGNIGTRNTGAVNATGQRINDMQSLLDMIKYGGGDNA